MCGYAKTKIVLRYANKNYFSIFKADYFLYVGTFMTDNGYLPCNFNIQSCLNFIGVSKYVLRNSLFGNLVSIIFHCGFKLWA